MKIGIVKEVKPQEQRVSMTPECVKELISVGHDVFVEKSAGEGTGFSDEQYIEAGAKMVSHAEAWNQGLVIKVKEPQPSEYKYFKKGQIIFTYLHLAAEKELTQALLKSGTTSVAYETVVDEDEDGKKTLPLLAPMSRVAGRLGAIVGAQYLQKHHEGRGILLGGVKGTEKGKTLVIGGGVAGYNSAFTAAGLGSDVVILELNDDRIQELKADSRLNKLAEAHGNVIRVEKSSAANIAKEAKDADILISTVLIPGKKAAKVVSTEVVKTMRPGSVIVDISIDQGGSVETITEVTTHAKPVIVKHGVSHYSVGNMPGTAPRTSTIALSDATLPYAIELADTGIDALKAKPNFALGLNTHEGMLTCAAVAEAFPEMKSKFKEPLEALK